MTRIQNNWWYNHNNAKHNQSVDISYGKHSISIGYLDISAYNIISDSLQNEYRCFNQSATFVIWYEWLSVVVSANMIWSIDVDVWWIAPLVPIV